jgi:uncharacterized protein
VIVVIDTNVWISALQFAKRRGTPTLALEKAMSEDVIATCDEIDAEIVRVLTKKFSWEQHRAMSALQAILARAIRVKIRGNGPLHLGEILSGLLSFPLLSSLGLAYSFVTR